MRDFLIHVAAGVFLAVGARVIFQWVLPFYLGWRNKAPNLAGNWSFYDSDCTDAPAVGHATFRQSGESIKASVVRTTGRKGERTCRDFKYWGRVRGGQLLLNFEEPVSGGYICGCLALKVSGDLKSLSGYTVYLDHDLGSVAAHLIIYRRT